MHLKRRGLAWARNRERKMLLHHTSPNVITKLTDGSNYIFGDCLFFSTDVYSASGGPVHVYELEQDDDSIIEECRLYNAESVEEVIHSAWAHLDIRIDEETAGSLLDGSMDVYELAPAYLCDGTPYADLGWQIQRIQGECAVKMGYQGCEAFDEQGTVYIIPMRDREHELNLVESPN